MINWVIATNSNIMDKVVGYQSVLQRMRLFCQGTGAPATETIRILNTPGPAQVNTSLVMTRDNFTITMVNGTTIQYTYPTNLPTLNMGSIPGVFPHGRAPDASEKACLLYLLPEAARSEIIENAFVKAIRESSTVTLSKYAVLVKNYQNTCNTVGVNHLHPARPLVAADYTAWANTLQPGNPKIADVTLALT